MHRPHVKKLEMPPPYRLETAQRAEETARVSSLRVMRYTKGSLSRTAKHVRTCLEMRAAAPGDVSSNLCADQSRLFVFDKSAFLYSVIQRTSGSSGEELITFMENGILEDVNCNFMRCGASRAKLRRTRYS